MLNIHVLFVWSVLPSIYFSYVVNRLQPNIQSKTQKEGAESEQFWGLLGGKSEYPSQKIVKDAESDPHLFSCHFSKGMDNFNVSR